MPNKTSHVSILILFLCLWIGQLYANRGETDSTIHIKNNRKNLISFHHKDLSSFFLHSYDKDSLLDFSEQIFTSIRPQTPVNEMWLGLAWAMQGKAFVIRKEYDQAIVCLQKALPFQKDLQVKILMEVYELLSYSYYKNLDLPSKIFYIQKKIDLGLKIKDFETVMGDYNEIGGSYYDLSMYSKALSFYFKAEETFERLNDEQKKVRLNQRIRWLIGGNIATIYILSEDWDKAYQQAQKNLELVQTLDESDLAGSYGSLGEILLAKGEKEKGLSYLLKAMELRRKVGIPIWTSSTAIEIGNYYLNERQYSKAAAYFQEAMDEIISEDVDLSSKVAAYNKLGELYLETSQLSKAIEYCETGLKLIEAGLDSELPLRMNNCLCLSRAYEKLGDTDLALKYHKMYSESYIEYLNRVDVQTLKEISIRAEFEKIRLRDSLDFAGERFQMQLGAEQQKRQRNLVFFLAIALISILTFLFFARRWKFQVELQRKKEETDRLKELNAFKSRLYTNLTHEFRTPLTVILGMVDQIRQEPKKYLEKGTHLIERNGKNLLRLINQLLDLSKLESKSLQLHLQQGDIIPFLRYVTESFQTYTNSKNLSLRFFSTSENLVMDYDQEQIKQVITNLISNAVKFTPSGGEIKLKVSKEELQLKIEISDTGIGIKDKDLPHIFDRFYQASPDDHFSGLTKGQGGTGIGLAHTQELIKLMNGSINVQSKLNQGTQFTICLPIQNKAKAQDNTQKQEWDPLIGYQDNGSTWIMTPGVSKGKDLPHLLIIEDNPDVVYYLKSCLINEYQLDVAYNGKIGIEKALENIPDLIISDVMMPEKDGFAVCNTLKNDERTSHIPIILLTAKADIESKITGIRRGADAYLAKPFNKEELLARLDQLVEQQKKMIDYFSKHLKSEVKVKKEQDQAIQIENVFVQKVRKIVAENYMDDNFALPQLCQKMGMSRSQLFRKMKALMDISPSQFIRSYRMGKAKELLIINEFSVSEVAWKVGFKDLGHFSRTYQDTFGLKPSETNK